MSNKSQLQTNNTALDALITRVNVAKDIAASLPEAGGGNPSDPFAPVVPFTYTINEVSGASYGFAINSNGYYESQNKNVNSSYALCRVNLTVTSTCDIVFDVINYAESNFDYAVFGKLDSALALSNTADSTAKENFKGKQSASVVNVTYSGVTVGSHYIDIKFIKDGSQHNNNDSVQFKIQEQQGLSQETINKILAADTALVAENIKSGVDIFGVIGNYEGSGGANVDVCTVTFSEDGTYEYYGLAYTALIDNKITSVTVAEYSSTYTSTINFSLENVICGSVISLWCYQPSMMPGITINGTAEHLDGMNARSMVTFKAPSVAGESCSIYLYDQD